MKMKLLIAVAAAALLSTTPAFAHHSLTATYLSTQSTIEATVVQFLFRNPHCFLQVEARDAKGGRQMWNVEWYAGGLLSRQGINAGTLKPGDRVIIVGNPARQPDDHRMRMVSVTRPSDGWKWCSDQEQLRSIQ